MQRPVLGLRFIPGGQGTTSSMRRTGAEGARYVGSAAPPDPAPAPKIEAILGARGLRLLTVVLGAAAGPYA